MLYLICTTMSRVEHARYDVPYAQELETCIWGPCYISMFCATGINVICATAENINPRFRFKIKASYIVSGKVTSEELPYWPLKQPNKH